ncbi:MAG: DNA N-6-adenine-methyltransferase [Methylocella sp.]
MTALLPHHPLAALFPLLEGDEFNALVADIRAYGLRQRIVLFEDMILDGRNRYAACIEAGIEPRFEVFNGTYADALAFVVSLNLARRHLNESQRAMIAARIATLRLGDNQHSEGLPIGAASEMLNVGPRSVVRAKAVLNEGIPKLVSSIERGEISVSAAAELARLSLPEQLEIVEAGLKRIVEAIRAIRSEGVEQFRSRMPKFTGDFEWYTPAEFIEPAVEVMGGIDCDPASCADANKIVGAKVFYSQDGDGLKQEWHGRVWLNPPYAIKLLKPFTSRLLEKYACGKITEAIVLTNNVTETSAIQTLIQSCHAICFPEGRIDFDKPPEQKMAKSNPLHGQMLFYFDKNALKFRHVFGRKGEIVLPWREDALALIGPGAEGEP